MSAGKRSQVHGSNGLALASCFGRYCNYMQPLAGTSGYPSWMRDRLQETSVPDVSLMRSRPKVGFSMHNWRVGSASRQQWLREQSRKETMSLGTTAERNLWQLGEHAGGPNTYAKTWTSTLTRSTKLKLSANANFHTHGTCKHYPV